MKILIEGASYDVPEEDEWELVEVAEVARLRDKWGDIGVTIAIVWIVKRRENAAFTIEEAERVKVGSIEEVVVPDAPLSDSDGKSETKPSSPGPSDNPEGSGQPLSVGSTG